MVTTAHVSAAHAIKTRFFWLIWAALFLNFTADNANDDMMFTNKHPAEPSFHEAAGIIRVGEAGAWLTDYTQLTMAVQFRDSQLVTKITQRLRLGPGTYRIALVEESNNVPRFQLSVAPVNTDTITVHFSVPWFD